MYGRKVESHAGWGLFVAFRYEVLKAQATEDFGVIVFPR